MSSVRAIRRFSKLLNISEEITLALHNGIPVVSLESTIITHGFPYPANLEMARKVEQSVRDSGAIPATCAFIDGKPFVGLSDTQIQFLAEQKGVNKVSRRDIGVTMAQKLNGGTTIAGTMILSHLAGIKVFATGGLGGVHRDGHVTMDVSADLTELGRTPVNVVCAGPKLILDIPRTMEYLETQGVFVATYNDDGRDKVEIPGFFCRESGVLSPYSYSSWKEAAEMVHFQNQVVNSGTLLCVPPGKDAALLSEFISSIIDEANNEAIARGVHGKELTPFLLQKIAKDTKGKSVECNMNFVINNAKAGSQIAKELLEIDESTKDALSSNLQAPLTFQPSTKIWPKKEFEEERTTATEKELDPEAEEEYYLDLEHEIQEKNDEFDVRVDTVIIGLMALDTISTLNEKTVMEDSNPGVLRSSIGGVGYNVALAHKYGLESQNSTGTYRFLSSVGDDFAGESLLKLQKVDGVFQTIKEAQTSQYTAILDSGGELIVACADMAIFENDKIIEELEAELTLAGPRFVVVDCNLSAKALDRVVSKCKELGCKVIVEPTSQPKLARIAQVGTKNLPVFPNSVIQMITPTVAELGSIHAAFGTREYFDDYDQWFPILDSLGVDAQFREKMEALSRKNKSMEYLLHNGVLQQSFQLLPYIPNILVKLGDKGVVLVKLSGNITDYRSIPTTSKFRPEFILTSQGKQYEEDKTLGIVVQHFPVPPENADLEIVNVTGAGDSLLGYLTSSLVKDDWLGPELENIEEEWAKWESVNKAQIASGLTLQSQEAISPAIATIK